MVHAHDVSKQIPREKKFPSVTPRATLTHLSCSPNFPRTSYLDERTLTYEPIVKYTSAMCEETLLAQSRQNRLKSVSTRAPGSRASCHLTDFNETLPVWRVYHKTKKDKLVSLLVFSGGDRPPPQGNRFKIGKMYEALTVMVFNQLFWAFAHIFFHP